MKRITITRDNGKVKFQTVTVTAFENVFFLNLDPQEEHWPTIAPKKLGKASSAPSDKCFPQPQYGCHFHANEKGIINMPQPGKPGKPGKPAKPGKPTMSGKPVMSGKPKMSGKPGKPGL